MMSNKAEKKLVEVLDDTVQPLSPQEENYASLLEQIADARFVLIGEASHGTDEFYRARIEITKQLIEKKGFMAVAIEGDWPDAYRIHRYIQGKGDVDAVHSLDDFKRFPTWMWRNKVLPEFLDWLRHHNEQLSETNKIGFYGLDLYSLNASMQAVITYLTKVDPEAAKRAKLRYACFDHMNVDPQTYGYLTSMDLKKSCEKEAIEQLLDMQHHAFDYVKRDGLDAEDEYFYATQNARVVKNAEKYYRTMFEGHIESWNNRDKHMHETLNILTDHLENRFEKPAKIIVWAHNSHVGDARATEMGDKNEINIGQLVREEHEADTYLIGFSTYQGTVTAASDWDAPTECKKVNPGMVGSYEELFHRVKHHNFMLHLHGNEKLDHYLHPSRLQRAIGVIYRPDTERQSHYFFTRLPYQFDSIIHFDETHAVKPL